MHSISITNLNFRHSRKIEFRDVKKKRERERKRNTIDYYYTLKISRNSYLSLSPLSLSLFPFLPLVKPYH